MKVFQALFLLMTLATFACGQKMTDTPYGMTSDQNMDWLTRVKNADKELKLKLVGDRLFGERTSSNPSDNLDVPVLIIDGIPVDNIDAGKSVFLNSELTAEYVDIQVIEKEPEGVYINKAFTGIVLIVITDKRTSKKFRKLR